MLRAGDENRGVGRHSPGASVESHRPAELKGRMFDAVGPPVVTTPFGPEWPAGAIP